VAGIGRLRTWFVTFALSLTPEAEEDFAKLIASLPPGRRDQAVLGVQAALLQFAKHPVPNPRPQHPFVRLDFESSGVKYYWAATYQFSPDETTIIITHMYRLPL
jgi:hypothetical protein